MYTQTERLHSREGRNLSAYFVDSHNSLRESPQLNKRILNKRGHLKSMKSSKSAFEFRGSELSLKSQNSPSPNRHRPSSSSRHRSSRSESTRSLSSSSFKELRSSLTSPAIGSAISTKAAAVTSRLYPMTDGGFNFLKKGFYDVR